MDIINGLHGLGIALAIAAGVTLLTLFFSAAATGDAPPHAVKIIAAALALAITAGFLIGATA